MKFLARLTLILSLLGCVAACAPEEVVVVAAQASQATGTGTITGRVTIGDKPAQGIAVLLLPTNLYGPERKPVARATTDTDGQFRLMNLAAGRYEVAPVAPAFVSAANLMHERNQGKSVNLAEGETIDKLDFSLVRGGVITGRVTDADARPVIGQNVRLATAAAQGNERRGGGSMFSFSSSMFQTDDRGIYRIYGIPPGTYVVSVGEDSRSGMARIGIGRGGVYTRTFHPNATEESKAAVIEVTEGGEATNVDITLNRRVTTYSVSGRVIDAETGKPLANIRTGYGSLRENEPQVGAIGLGTRTDADGYFRFEGLMPGRYAAFTATSERSEDYSTPVSFEVNEGDVSGLTIKVRRGASISGVAVIEGASDRAALARLAQVRIYYWPESNDKLVVPIFGQGERVNPDGSFRISGLPPGKFRLMLGGWPPPKGFSLLRVERDGVEQRAGIVDVPAGGQVTGVRFVLEYGTAILRGQVRVENGTLPEGAHLYVSARRPTAAEPTLPGAEVDARGRFVMEGLPAGQYELRLGVNGLVGQRIPAVVQNVSVTNGVETQVTLVIDMAAKDETNK
jgi:protocatechuate 3,4-dioxygenase beta subunit